jgi:hypothetical protein
VLLAGVESAVVVLKVGAVKGHVLHRHGFENAKAVLHAPIIAVENAFKGASLTGR